MSAASPSTASTTTSTELLRGLLDPANHDIWRRYVDRYQPVLVRYARRVGIREADVEDVAQQILVAFSTAYRQGRYDPDRGRLRDWLFGIARLEVRNWRRRTQAALQADSDVMEACLAGDDDGLQAAWDQEWHAAVLRHCLANVRTEVQPQTMEAFELFAIQEWPAQRVAKRLGMTENAVFGAKRRVLRRLRELQAFMERDF